MSQRGQHDCYGAVAELPPHVLRLFDAAGQRDFQASAAWFDNFVQTVDLGDARPEFHVWSEGGRALVVLPLLRRAGALGSSVTALGNYYTTRWQPLVADDLSPREIAVCMKRVLWGLLREGHAHTLSLGPLEADSPAERALMHALRRAGCAVWPQHGFQNWILPLGAPGPRRWPDYLAARDGKLRTTITRMGKRFAAKGGRLELLHGDIAEADLARAIAAWQAIYAASWKDPEPHVRFMPGMIRAAAAAGQLRLALAWQGELPVAAQVWMVAGGRADIYKLAHDERHKEHSPGTLLTTLLMQHVFEVDGVDAVDYLSGDDAYKRLWMSEVRERRALLAHDLRSVRGLALAGRQQLASWARALLRRDGTADA